MPYKICSTNAAPLGLGSLGVTYTTTEMSPRWGLVFIWVFLQTFRPAGAKKGGGWFSILTAKQFRPAGAKAVYFSTGFFGFLNSLKIQRAFGESRHFLFKD